MIFAQALASAFHEILKQDPRVVVLGEDIADPYGGAFKATKGLSTAFPDRVFSTPVSEAAITGVSAGLALSGFRPIVEIMFGDFLSLSFDQILNHITKYEPVYNRQVRCPVIVRTPSGGGKGYGPTHSQSLEKFFLGMPNLLVIAASLHHDPLQIYKQLLSQDYPALYVEHKLLYPRRLILPDKGRVGELLASVHISETNFPTAMLSSVPREDCVLTIVAYGYQAAVAEEIVKKLAVDEEIFIELVVPSQISPVDYSPIRQSVDMTGRLLTVEEGTAGWSWGTEIAHTIEKQYFGKLRSAVEVCASESSIIPSAKHLEDQMLVHKDKMEKIIRKMLS